MAGPIDQDALRQFWRSAPTGRLCPWEVAKALGAIKEAEMEGAVGALTLEQCDVLMKYLYRGLGIPGKGRSGARGGEMEAEVEKAESNPEGRSKLAPIFYSTQGLSLTPTLESHGQCNFGKFMFSSDFQARIWIKAAAELVHTQVGRR